MPLKKKISKKTVKKKEENKLEIIRAPNFQKFYVTNVEGGMSNQDFRFELMNEKFIDKEGEGEALVSDALLILSPIAAKKLFEKLGKNLELYQKKFGKIETSLDDISYSKVFPQ